MCLFELSRFRTFWRENMEENYDTKNTCQQTESARGKCRNDLTSKRGKTHFSHITILLSRKSFPKYGTPLVGTPCLTKVWSYYKAALRPSPSVPNMAIWAQNDVCYCIPHTTFLPRCVICSLLDICLSYRIAFEYWKSIFGFMETLTSRAQKTQFMS